MESTPGDVIAPAQHALSLKKIKLLLANELSDDMQTTLAVQLDFAFASLDNNSHEIEKREGDGSDDESKHEGGEIFDNATLKKANGLAMQTLHIHYSAKQLSDFTQAFAWLLHNQIIDNALIRRIENIIACHTTAFNSSWNSVPPFLG